MLKNKRGQFFILSAVILSLILTSLTSIYNSSNTSEEPQSLYDLTENIKNEGFEVIDYGFYNSKDMQSTLIGYADNISDYILNTEPDAEFFFVYGNTTAVILEDYTKDDVQSTISLQTGQSITFISVNAPNRVYRKTNRISITITDPNFNITIDNRPTQIHMNPGQNFIIVMKKTYKNNTYIDLK